MAEETPRTRMTMIEAAAAAVSFERLLGAGLLVLLGLIIIGAFFMAEHPPQGEGKLADATLSFFKDMGLMVGTALVACLRGRHDKPDA